jgi:aminoglycoside phosphotransferase family enzyme/predicted kinase
MSKADFYPDPADTVELRETHTSWVFLAGEFAYKVRKPVSLPFIDCSTSAKRRALCALEMEVNSRLAPDVYLDIVPIMFSSGRYHLDRAGDTRDTEVDFAVKMRRLPDTCRLDRLIGTDEVAPKSIEAIAQRMAEFHRASDRAKSWTHGCAARVWQLILGNLNEARDLAADTLTEDRLTAIGNFSRRFIAARWEFINQRARDGRVCDGHGDLRGDAVYLLPDGIEIIDALEFSERLRYGDVGSDIAFLAMDLDRLGRPDYASQLVRSYATAADDPDVELLMPLYKSYRATVRAKVELIRSRQEDCPVDERVLARERARTYLELGLSYAEAPSPRALIVVCGLSGTGKSTLAHELHELTGFQVFASDTERKHLAGVAPTQHLGEPYGVGVYSQDFTQMAYASLIARAEEILNSNRGVILDATFRRRNERAMVVELGGRAGLDPIFVECQAEKSEVIRRLIERSARLDEVSDATVEIYLAQLREFEPLTEIAAPLRIAARTDGTQGNTAVLTAIERRIHAHHR